MDFLWKAGESPALLFCFAKGFASAEATKGLSGRPLETFGGSFAANGGCCMEQLSYERARESPSPVSISKKSKPALPIQKSGQIHPT